MKSHAILGCALFVGFTCVAGAVETATPATQPADGTAAVAPADDVGTLIKQLGDDSFRSRQEATRKLKQMGKAALPALKAAQRQDDPAIHTAAEKLVQDIERPQPARPIPQPTGSSMHSIRMSTINGDRSVDVTEEGRTIHIEQNPRAGLKMKVTGQVDGQEVTREYKADSPEQLKRDNPEAFALFQQYGGNAGDLPLNGVGGFGVKGNIQLNMNGAAGFRGLRHVRPAVPPAPVRRQPGADDLDQLRDNLLGEMEGAKVPADQREQVKGLLKQLQEALPPAFDATGNDVDAQMREYNRRSDALRKQLEALKLPDPGDALPPPAAGRLGISAREESAEGEGLTITHVLPDSRAERIGLREFDVVQKINGKPIHNTKELRRMVTENAKGLIVEGMRDGKPMKLEEK